MNSSRSDTDLEKRWEKQESVDKKETVETVETTEQQENTTQTYQITNLGDNTQLTSALFDIGNAVHSLTFASVAEANQDYEDRIANLEDTAIDKEETRNGFDEIDERLDDVDERLDNVFSEIAYRFKNVLSTEDIEEVDESLKSLNTLLKIMKSDVLLQDVKNKEMHESISVVKMQQHRLENYANRLFFWGLMGCVALNLITMMIS